MPCDGEEDQCPGFSDPGFYFAGGVDEDVSYLLPLQVFFYIITPLRDLTFVHLTL